MANFVIVVDPDSERRSHFIQTIKPLIPPIDGLVTQSCSAGNFEAIWAANPQAPISYVADSTGAAVVWGEAIASGNSTRINAVQIKTLWREVSEAGSPGFDGFYAAVVYDPERGLIVGADHLGLFPVYYYINHAVTLVGSSPELFKYHPQFQATFNPAGLVGILLTNGLVKGQTLWQEVQRLQPGHLLIWHPNGNFREVSQNSIAALADHEGAYDGLSFAEHLEALNQTLEQVLMRHAPEGQPYSLLLSGGLDSRMIAGFLERQNIAPVALTLGIKSDLEMQCAIPVACTLGLAHHRVAVPFQEYPALADLQVRWEHLTNGFNWVMNWGIGSALGELAPKAIAGYALDVAVGGPLPLPTKTPSFEAFFQHGVNNWGFSPQQLERLLRQEIFGEPVQEVLAQIQATYESYSEDEERRTWWFELYHRQRFHVGSMAWQLCFSAWPVLPILDWQLLKTTAVLPVKTLEKRQAQKQLVCKQFPHLARLPLDRNDYNVEPLQPDPFRQRLAPIWGLQRKWRKLQHKLGYERRYYYRIYDINSPGWQAVRQHAEPYRDRVQPLLNSEVLQELLPAPEVPIQFKRDSIIEASGVKALLGFLLWSRDYL